MAVQEAACGKSSRRMCHSISLAARQADCASGRWSYLLGVAGGQRKRCARASVDARAQTAEAMGKRAASAGAKPKAKLKAAKVSKDAEGFEDSSSADPIQLFNAWLCLGSARRRGRN